MKDSERDAVNGRERETERDGVNEREDKGGGVSWTT